MRRLPFVIQVRGLPRGAVVYCDRTGDDLYLLARFAMGGLRYETDLCPSGRIAVWEPRSGSIEVVHAPYRRLARGWTRTPWQRPSQTGVRREKS